MFIIAQSVNSATQVDISPVRISNIVNKLETEYSIYFRVVGNVYRAWALPRKLPSHTNLQSNGITFDCKLVWRRAIAARKFLKNQGFPVF
jgi:hypothetical protein